MLEKSRKPLFIIIIIFCFVAVSVLWKYTSGKNRADVLFSSMQNIHLDDRGDVTRLKITPLVEFFSARNDLETEAGLSLLVQADETSILMDMGLNRYRKHPSPAVSAMSSLGVSPDSLDMIFISHCHPDHVGGMREAMSRSFSLSQGYVPVGRIPVYTPETMKPTAWNKDLEVSVVAQPFLIRPGIASTGPVPRYSLVGGMILEQSLLIRLKGKGIVVVIGCGHGGLERILSRAVALYNEPVYAVIGGLHLPVGASRVGPSFLNIQNFGATERFPVGSAADDDVDAVINTLRSYNPAVIAVSGHDSSDKAIEKIKSGFRDRFRILKAGECIDM